jgi:hypothetical protein
LKYDKIKRPPQARLAARQAGQCRGTIVKRDATVYSGRNRSTKLDRFINLPVPENRVNSTDQDRESTR